MFYEKLGFTKFDGDQSQGWLILRNGVRHGRPVPGDVRAELPDVQPGLGRRRAAGRLVHGRPRAAEQLREAGVAFSVEADELGSDPPSSSSADPDGNPIFVDQHV